MKPKKQKAEVKRSKDTVVQLLWPMELSVATTLSAVASTLLFLDENYLYAVLCLVFTVAVSFCCVCEWLLFFLTRKKDEIDNEEKSKQTRKKK